MKLKVVRKYPRETYCIGKLYVDGTYFCDTLEDRIVDKNENGKFDNGEKKVYGKTAIPYGKYSITFTYSPKFAAKPKYAEFLKKGLMPLLNNVPQFETVRIHGGNTAEDTLGCLLVGRNTVVGKLTESLNTFKKLYQKMWKAYSDGEKITIEYVSK